MLFDTFEVFVWHHDTLRIIELLDLSHQLEHSLVSLVVNVLCFRNSQTMLSTDAAVFLLNPLVDPWLDCCLHFLVIPSDRYTVEVSKPVKIQSGVW